jgi:hypothetical protein
MDTGKLLKIIDDIRVEESTHSIQSSLDNIVSYYSQDTATSLANIETEKNKIYSAVMSSRISQYAASDYDALVSIGVDKLFGPGLFQRLNDILHAQAHEITTLLQTLVSERSTALTSLSTLQKGLTDFNFKSRALTDHNYEIGFVLPESYTELQKIENAIGDFRKFLSELAAATGEQQPLKIEYVSNGTIELFVHSSINLAEHFGAVLAYALLIYDAIKDANDVKDKIKSYAKKRKSAVEKQIADQKEEEVNKLIDEMIAALGITEHEAITRVKQLFKIFLHHLEHGVSAEVHTPELAPPPEPAADATKEEKATYSNAKKMYDQKLKIDEKNREIFILQQNNFYGMNTKFLNNPDSSNES